MTPLIELLRSRQPKGNMEIRRMIWHPARGKKAKDGDGQYKMAGRIMRNDPQQLTEFLYKADGDYFHGVNTRTPGTSSGTKIDIHEIISLFVDVDFKKVSSKVVTARIKGFEFPPTAIVNSGYGLHYYWVLMKPILIRGSEEVINQAEGIGLGLANYFDSDHVQNIDRILRLPGFVNTKWSNRPVCREISVKGPLYKIDDFTKYWREPLAKPDNRIVLGQIEKEIPDKFVQLRKKEKQVQQTWDGKRSNLTDDSRSGYDMAMAGLLAWRGFPPEEIASVLSQMPSGKGSDATSAYFSYTISKVLESTHVDETPEDMDKTYVIRDGEMCRIKEVKEGNMIVPLCNFTAKVNEQIILDDGMETTRSFVVRGKLASGSTLPDVRVPAVQFNGMVWVTREWGLHAIVHAGQATRDFLREAIQVYSPDATERKIYTHTGWRHEPDGWIFLTASGAVGRDGYEVELGSDLSRYSLPLEPEDPAEAMKVSLELFKIAPASIIVPLWSAVFGAPLAESLPVDLSILLEGPTGSMKSTVAALFLCHYGSFTRILLPGSWASTANRLERDAFRLKDVPFVVDEYVLTSINRRELEAKASRLLRAQGNRSGRGRLRADLTERPTWPPRGLIISTGEQHPPGQSLLARALLVRMQRSQIDISALSRAQNLEHRLAHAMVGYLSWLAPQMDKLPEVLRANFEVKRREATTKGQHLRVPEVLAHLWLGIDYGLTYAEEIGACSTKEAQRLRKESWDALTGLGKLQGQLLFDERPLLKFLRVLSTMVTQKKAVLHARGYSEELSNSDVQLLGWWDKEFLYLMPEASYKAAYKFCQEAGDPLVVGPEALNRDFLEAKISVVDKGRLTATVWLGAKKGKRVLKLSLAAIKRELGEAFPT